MMNIYLVYFQPVSNADFIVPVEIDGTIHQVRIHSNTNCPGKNSSIIKAGLPHP